MFLDNLDILKLEKILSGKIQLIWLGQRNYGDFGWITEREEIKPCNAFSRIQI